MTQATIPLEVRFKFLHPVWEEHGCEYSTEHSAGLDLRACLDEDSITVPAGGRAFVGAGVAIEISEPGWAGFVFSRSGLGAKDGLTVAQGVGVIDPDYRGEIKVCLLNTSGEPRVVTRGQRIAQLVFMPFRRAGVVACDDLSSTARGTGGFGHTGKL
ncbi:deoxyuridine 5'-triphosphate nucleotidohydrolase Dut [Desulfovibrio sp. X2]|uniref:dUTP diphosphatase n=1 Tax=Desulfovibrio sp. X2 TaxID=941449 RepID=UPI000358BCC3|nr:dUTP diphosphatase [Desulfovibrio sp. X2]EPR42404.1 deoxyuridine 5'-triphosphate nucleotidohydrolase Dut [Desulfovibrio sp. X2]